MSLSEIKIVNTDERTSENTSSVETITDAEISEMFDKAVEEQDREASESEEEIVLENNPEVRSYVDEVINKIIAKQLERKGINEEIQALYTEAETKGLNRKGLKVALTRYKLTEEQREAMDFTYSICCSVKHMVPNSQIELFNAEVGTIQTCGIESPT